jgi:DNA-directed RNA polymerase subunit RPC12/RpoP
MDAASADCWACWTAATEGLSPMQRAMQARMIVCPACGNKRCPRATDHRLACTGSNEPGQKGIRYE